MLSEILNSRPLLLLGMGNPLRGDDAIGHLLAEALEPLGGEGFQAHAVGTAVENAMRWIRETAGGTLLLVDAVFDESLAEGSWALYPSEQLDSMCHSTHSIPLSMLIAYSLPLLLKLLLDRSLPKNSWWHAIFYALVTLAVIIYTNSSNPDFIYFQF